MAKHLDNTNLYLTSVTLNKCHLPRMTVPLFVLENISIQSLLNHVVMAPNYTTTQLVELTFF